MSVRGIRGATTVEKNMADNIIKETKRLMDKIISQNNLHPNQVAQILVSLTDDLNADFPAKAIRTMDGWSFVPVMCMKEIAVPHALPKCIRIMVTANTDIPQEHIQHVYLNKAMVLRPDLEERK
ncbi:chorismate mutase [Metabacillus iocasae]|uniref:chorismate mutase n=1 Tax=Priestia iocasae TaxID=2291674 RepID=A0ABS2QQJ3_9BACI|nr:chorismate mutase [Metabacillus iocasae]MBM7701725.1 chorismate mutase [Metabacillus iocasae]